MTPEPNNRHVEILAEISEMNEFTFKLMMKQMPNDRAFTMSETLTAMQKVQEEGEEQIDELRAELESSVIQMKDNDAHYEATIASLKEEVGRLKQPDVECICMGEFGENDNCPSCYPKKLI